MERREDKKMGDGRGKKEEGRKGSGERGKGEKGRRIMIKGGGQGMCW